MRAREIEKILLADGWYLKNQKGSHRQYKHPTKPRKVTVPFHTGDVDKGTADSILKQTGALTPISPYIKSNGRQRPMKLVYPAIFTPCQEPPGYTVEVPDLPGCVTEGKTLSEAIEMGEDAASGWILDEIEDGNPYPVPSNYAAIACPPGSFLSLLLLDMDSYAEKYGSKVVRKNISIPAWLNTYGEKNGINFSRVLQDALYKAAESDSDREIGAE